MRYTSPDAEPPPLPAGGREQEPEVPPGPPSLLAVAITIAGICALGLLVWLIEPLNDAFSAALRGDTVEVRSEVRGLGFWGPLAILALCLIHSFVFYPAEIVDAAAGFVYGFGPALALVMGGWLLNGLVCWTIGRRVARPLLERLLGRERFDRTEAMVERGGVSLLLGVRLVPILPFSLVSYAAGAARVPLGRFLWTTALGYFPITAVSVYLGTRLEDLRPTDPLLLAALGALLVLLLVGRWVARR